MNVVNELERWMSTITEANYTPRKQRRRTLIVLVVVCGTVVFGIASGIEGYCRRVSPGVTVLSGTRLATPTELITWSLLDVVLAIPLGAIASVGYVALLTPIASLSSRGVPPPLLGFLVGGFLGGGIGLVLSIGSWIIAAGWGPGYLLQAVLCGVATGGGLFAFLPRASRAPPGRCKNCEYNLTGNVSGVCPECGTKIELRRGDSE